jgi:hypothetical protein
VHDAPEAALPELRHVVEVDGAHQVVRAAQRCLGWVGLGWV